MTPRYITVKWKGLDQDVCIFWREDNVEAIKFVTSVTKKDEDKEVEKNLKNMVSCYQEKHKKLSKFEI